MKKIVLINTLIFFINSLFGQDCPNRIGDFILNETTISKLPKICDICEIQLFKSISNGEQFLEEEVDASDLNNSDIGSTSLNELFFDDNNINGWYSTNYACVNDSVRVLFLPNYETDEISIKNLLLKFYNDTLFYISASLSKSYADIILEKYRGMGTQIKDKKTKCECEKVISKNCVNRYFEYLFSSKTKNYTSARIIFDIGIPKNCIPYSLNRIEIFNQKIWLKELYDGKEDLKKIVDEKNSQIKKEKEKVFERF